MTTNYLDEYWADHPYYEDILVSCFGRIFSFKRCYGIELKQSDNGCGYLRVGIGHGNPQYVHRLVAETFVYNSEPNIKVEVNHIDGYKFNNHFSNLEWCTRSENSLHAFSTGLKINKGRAVKIVETGKVYPSGAECARQINGIQGNIALCLTGKRNTHRGYHFEYLDGDGIDD